MDQQQVVSEVNSITMQLIKKIKPTKIILFGSAVTGRMTPDSDLDFLIIKHDDRKFHDRVVEVYRLVKKEMPADFFVHTPDEIEERVKLGDPFIKFILESGRVLYG